MKRAVVLLSGGMDSAVTAALVLEARFAAYALTVDYGQRHAIEIDAARAVARQLGLREHRVLRLDLRAIGGSALTDASIDVPLGREDAEIGAGIPVTYVPARNMIFLALATAWAETLGASDLFIGANALDYSGYPDCRPEFLAAFQALTVLGTRAGIEGAGFLVHAPLLHMTKARIAGEAKRLGVDLGLTFSCYAPVASAPCGGCDACRLRARGFAQAGLDDPGWNPGRAH